MKILQINKYYYRKGGADIVFLDTISLLEKYGHTVIPFSIKNNKNLSNPYESYFVDFPELSESSIWTKIVNIHRFIYNKRSARNLDILLQKEQPDIVHIHLMFNSFSVSILPILKKHKIPIVMTLHDHRLICPAYTFKDGKGQICERCLKKQNYWQCIKYRCSKGNLANSILLTLDSYFRKYFISPLDYIAQFIFVGHFAQRKHIEVSSRFNKSEVLYNFTPVKEDSSDKENYLLYFGRISEEKGIPTLMKVMESFPKIELFIVGTGPLLEELRSKAAPNIHFVGFKSGKELYDYVKKAYFIIVPSEWYENNTMVIPEAFRLGTPAIASRIGGIPEFIQEGKNGYLFDPGSITQLRKLIQKILDLSPQNYKKMCKDAQLFAREYFSEDSYYKKLIALYERVLTNQ